MLSFEEIAKEIWTSLYPDRRPWEKLDNVTREEWEKLAHYAYIIIKDKL